MQYKFIKVNETLLENIYKIIDSKIRKIDRAQAHNVITSIEFVSNADNNKSKLIFNNNENLLIGLYPDDIREITISVSYKGPPYSRGDILQIRFSDFKDTISQQGVEITINSSDIFTADEITVIQKQLDEIFTNSQFSFKSGTINSYIVRCVPYIMALIKIILVCVIYLIVHQSGEKILSESANVEKRILLVFYSYALPLLVFFIEPLFFMLSIALGLYDTIGRAVDVLKKQIYFDGQLKNVLSLEYDNSMKVISIIGFITIILILKLTGFDYLIDFIR